MSNCPFSLSEYLQQVQAVIKLSFDDAVWVKAEIRNLSIKAGHYYFELAEKQPDSDRVLASCKATLWKFSAQKVVTKFERETGIELNRDLNILVKVRARFDAQYGFSVNIEDIDSNYTLGDLALRYQQIIEKLSLEGLIERNKGLPMPFDVQNVLVITPENAAGLGDFKKDADALSTAKLCQFVYHTATFQGNQAAYSIMNSLANALKQWAADFQYPPDLIVLIRGGGAVNDLAYLNDYDLAALLCKRSIPVWVGIGHEKDRTILDEIAHRTFDTPSKVIAGIRDHIVQRSQAVVDFLQKIQRAAQQHIAHYQHQNEQLIAQIEYLSQRQVSDAYSLLDQSKNNTEYFAQHLIKISQQHVEALMRETLLQNPRHVLSKGYAIVRQHAQVVGSVATLHADPVEIELHDGIFSAQITQVSPYES